MAVDRIHSLVWALEPFQSLITPMTYIEASNLVAQLKKQGRRCYTFKQGKTWVLAAGRKPQRRPRKDDMMYHAYRY